MAQPQHGEIVGVENLCQLGPYETPKLNEELPILVVVHRYTNMRKIGGTLLGCLATKMLLDNYVKWFMYGENGILINI